MSYVFLFWFAVRLLIETVMMAPNLPEQSLDANLMRLVGRVIGVAGSVFILGIGAQEFGLPFLSVLTGFGIGGIAVALAIRPTLENLFGGMILFMDKPVRVGDFCSFGNQTGTVERIGVRSTQVRGSDRTLVSIPNAKFADMDIVNWAQCDRMLINTIIGLR